MILEIIALWIPVSFVLAAIFGTFLKHLNKRIENKVIEERARELSNKTGIPYGRALAICGA